MIESIHKVRFGGGEGEPKAGKVVEEAPKKPFDRVGYQRELMRKRREAGRAVRKGEA